MIRNRDLEPVEVVGSWSDVTAPKEAEIAYRRSEQRLTDAIDSIPEGFSLYDADDRLIVCNSAYGNLLYHGAGTPASGTPYEVLIRNAVKYIDEAKGREEEWIRERLTRHKQPGEAHLQRRADGRWIQINERRTAEGGIIAVYTDITEIKRAEEDVREAKRQLEGATERMTQQKRELEILSTKLSKYLSPQVYSSIFTGQRGVEIASYRKKLTIFFSDIADFTATTEDLESEELTSLLNQYLTEMSNIALAHGATIDKYIGDAILAFFGDPETRGVREDALACVNMAIAMQRRMRKLEAEWRDHGLEKPFQIRVGISTGFCTVGNFGSEDRMDYTIIGGGVNLASRLQSNAMPGGIVLSHETWSLVKDVIAADEQEPMQVKGLSRPIRNYRVHIESAEPLARHIIREEHTGFKLFLDLKQSVQTATIEALKNALSRLVGS